MNQPLARVEGWIDKAWPQLVELVPRHVNQQRLRRIIIDQVRNNTQLQECTPESVFRSCVNAANLGLEVGVMNSAYLVKYGRTCTLIPGYAGLIQLARNSGAVRAVNVYTVRYNDEVVQHGDGSVFVQFNPFDKNRGHAVGWVCVLTMNDGSTQYTTMTMDEYHSVRPGHWERTPHRTHPEEMGKKSCVRRAVKMVPLTPEISDVISKADAAEYEEVEIEIKSEGGNAAVMDLLDEKLNDMIDEEEEVEAVEKEIDEAAPPPVVPAEQKIVRDWSIDLASANRLIAMMGVEGMMQWERMTKARKEMVLKRQIEEKITDQEAFWHRAFEVLTPFDPSKVMNWTTKLLDQFLRVPTKGNPDHFQIAAEGGYRPNGGGEDTPPPEPEYDPLAD